MKLPIAYICQYSVLCMTYSIVLVVFDLVVLYSLKIIVCTYVT